jgi:hypothetical protein
MQSNTTVIQTANDIMAAVKREKQNISPEVLGGMIAGILLAILLVSLLWYLRHRKAVKRQHVGIQISK